MTRTATISFNLAALPRKRTLVIFGVEVEIDDRPPGLHGDGVSDDWAALQWYADRRLPFPTQPGKTYCISKPLTFRG